MPPVVRVSKFRHVFGQGAKKSECYEGIRITRNAWDSLFCSVNPKFLAIITDSAGGGSFLVVPLSKVGRIDRDIPLINGHKAAVLDIAWCPHNDNVIASGSEDCSVKVWEIPDGGITSNVTEATVELLGHQRRVGQVLWHPTALNVLLSVGSDMKIIIWNVGKSSVLQTIECHPDMIINAAWNYNGSRLVTSCKDKMLRVINPRTGEVIQSGMGHASGKPARVAYLKDGRILSTGFSKTAERQCGVWDENDLSNPLAMQDIDSSNGILFPIYDEDTNVIFLCGKGDTTIKYFEYTPDAPYLHYLSYYTSSDPQRGLGVMPKRGLHIPQCEIARFYKLHNSGLCEVISFTVPRKSELFQDDIYPDTVADQHAITAEQWIQGTDADPILLSTRDLYTSQKSGSDTSHHKHEVKFVKAATSPTPSSEKPTKDSTSASAASKPLTDSKSMPTKKSEHHHVNNEPAHAPKNAQLDEILAQLKTITKRMEEFDSRLKRLENVSNKQHNQEANVSCNDENLSEDLRF